MNMKMIKKEANNGNAGKKIYENEVIMTIMKLENITRNVNTEQTDENNTMLTIMNLMKMMNMKKC